MRIFIDARIVGDDFERIAAVEVNAAGVPTGPIPFDLARALTNALAESLVLSSAKIARPEEVEDEKEEGAER